MRRTLAVVALLILPAAGLALKARPEGGAAQTPADPKATAVVDAMMAAMGGQASWDRDRARFLRFDWVVEREGKTVAHARHLWDRHEGRYRVEWASREGARLAALFNLNTRSGRVQVNGQPARDEDEQKYLDQAYGRFINDSYWLLMPWKLKDPGVKLEYAGEVQLDNQSYDLLHVSFENVGLTPGDHYWAYVNRRTHLMDAWAYFLQSEKGKPARQRATPWQWQRWEVVGAGLRLARERIRVGENMRISFPVLQVLDYVDERLFDSFDVPLSGTPPAVE